MSLRGQAIVAIWNDILPELRAEFIHWHDREHIPERVAIPGFRRGRRFDAIQGNPAYFTLYEADDTDVLSGKAYLDRLNNPTPWTRHVTQAFRNTSRGICRVAHSWSCAIGGVIVTLRFDVAPKRASALEGYLIETAFPPIVATRGIVGVHLAIADQAISGIETTERRGRAVAVPRWVAMIEASRPVDADHAGDQLLGCQLTDHGLSGHVDRGLYALGIMVDKA